MFFFYRNGPDWKSKLKYIPDPSDEKYPAAEIFENNWKAMRPFPRMYRVVFFKAQNKISMAL